MASDEPRVPAKSALDELLGTSSAPTSRPSTGANREFVLDDKYKKKEGKEFVCLFIQFQKTNPKVVQRYINNFILYYNF